MAAATPDVCAVVVVFTAVVDVTVSAVGSYPLTGTGPGLYLLLLRLLVPYDLLGTMMIVGAKIHWRTVNMEYAFIRILCTTATYSCNVAMRGVAATAGSPHISTTFYLYTVDELSYRRTERAT